MEYHSILARLVSDAWAAPSGVLEIRLTGGRDCVIVCPAFINTHSSRYLDSKSNVNSDMMFYPLKDEGAVQLAGEAAQPPEAHHAEDGDLLGGRRVRRPRAHQGPHVAHTESDQAQRGPHVPLGPTDEGHRVQEKIKTREHVVVS